MPMDRRARSWMGFDSEFSRRLGQAGLIGLMLPEEYGGAGLGPFSRFVIVEELLSAGAPVSAHWIAERQSAPLLLKFGTETQRYKYRSVEHPSELQSPMRLSYAVFLLKQTNQKQTL